MDNLLNNMIETALSNNAVDQTVDENSEHQQPQVVRDKESVETVFTDEYSEGYTRVINIGTIHVGGIQHLYVGCKPSDFDDNDEEDDVDETTKERAVYRDRVVHWDRHDDDDDLEERRRRSRRNFWIANSV